MDRLPWKCVTVLGMGLWLVVAFVGGHAYAQSDHPTTGLGYNTKETSSIWYDCKLKNTATLECEFTYSAVIKKANPEDWEKELAEADWAGIKADWEGGDTANLCKGLQELTKILTGKSSLSNDAEKKLSEIPEGQKADLLKEFDATKRLCRGFSKSAIIELFRLKHEKKTRTCSIYSSFDRQTFLRQGTADWVSVQEDHTSICRSVTVERFERAKTSGFDFWIFSRRKTVTNPSEKFLDMTCREFTDETEHKFDWRARDLYLNCDYIEFGL